MRFDVLTTPAQIAGLEEAWRRLEPHTRPFDRWEWMGVWGSSERPEQHPAVAVAFDGPDVVAILPLAIARTRWRGAIPLRRLEVLAAATHPDHVDAVVTPGAESVIERLWHHLAEKLSWDIVELDGLVPTGLLASLPQRGQVEATPAPRVKLPATWEEFSGRLGRNLRQNLGRYGRKLEREAGDAVGFETVEADLDRAMAEFEHLHQAVRTANGDPGIFATPELRGFHHQAAAALLNSGSLRHHRLTVGDRAIAAIHCWRHRDTVVFYATGYDSDWSRYGPGRAVMAHAIEAAIDEGASVFDFLRGDESYKQQWGVEEGVVARVRAARSVRGRFVEGVRRLR